MGGTLPLGSVCLCAGFFFCDLQLNDRPNEILRKDLVGASCVSFASAQSAKAQSLRCSSSTDRSPLRRKCGQTAIFLAGLSHEERLDWLKEHQYPHPISFEQGIEGTVYTVNAHFSGKIAETVEGQVERILNQNIAH